jgi:hypothetical protein
MGKRGGWRPNSGRKQLAHINQAQKYVYYQYRYAARKRGLAFDLTEDDVNRIVLQDCYYCGSAPHRTYHYAPTNAEFTYNGIDRIDNALGYVVGNCATCCWECNLAKGQRGIHDFIAWAHQIANQHPV